MKRLLVVGSCSIHLYNFIHLVKEYFDEILFLTHEECNMHLSDIEIIKIDFRLSSFLTPLKILNILKKFEPTHIHVHQANSYAFFTFLASRKILAKKILNVWGSDILISPKKNFLLRKLVEYSLRNADYVIGDSFTLLKEAKKIYPNIKTENINFGIEIPKCKVKKENIIYSNRLHKKLYNIDKVIISFYKFVQNNHNWKLIIAGEGEETENLKNLVKSLGINNKVHFIGFVDKETNHYYYCKSKIYVSVPSSDSVSLSLIEALLSGCIVFVTDIQANREVVTENLGFFERDLNNINFLKYQELENRRDIQELEKLKRVYSKDYNKERLIRLYES